MQEYLCLEVTPHLQKIVNIFLQCSFLESSVLIAMAMLHLHTAHLSLSMMSSGRSSLKCFHSLLNSHFFRFFSITSARLPLMPLHFAWNQHFHVWQRIEFMATPQGNFPDLFSGTWSYHEIITFAFPLTGPFHSNPHFYQTGFPVLLYIQPSAQGHLHTVGPKLALIWILWRVLLILWWNRRAFDLNVHNICTCVHGDTYTCTYIHKFTLIICTNTNYESNNLHSSFIN